MEQPPQRRRRQFGLTVLGVAVIATLVAAILSWTNRTAPTHLPGTASLPTASISTVQAPPRSPPSSVAPKPVTGQRHDAVVAAAPDSFTFQQKAFTIKARVCGMDYVRPLDPPGEQHHTVCWVQHDFGVAPGSAPTGTTYVLGHSWGQDQLEVLNKISATAMTQVLALRKQHKTTKISGIATYQVSALNGAVITLRTANGILRYTVRNAYAVAKTQAGNVKPLMAEHTPNRVVVITCGELNHVDYDYNIIVQAYLTSSIATPSKT